MYDFVLALYVRSTPTTVFPRVSPDGVPKTVPDEVRCLFPLKDFELPDDDTTQPKKKQKTESQIIRRGNRSAYLAEQRDNGGKVGKLSYLCNLGQHHNNAGKYNGPIKIIAGGSGALLKMNFIKEEPDPSIGYLTCAQCFSLLAQWVMLSSDLLRTLAGDAAASDGCWRLATPNEVRLAGIG